MLRYDYDIDIIIRLVIDNIRKQIKSVFVSGEISVHVKFLFSSG